MNVLNGSADVNAYLALIYGTIGLICTVRCLLSRDRVKGKTFAYVALGSFFAFQCCLWLLITNAR